MTTCPSGHPSIAEDYCDHCGAPMSAAAVPVPADETPEMTAAVSAPPAALEPCPSCGAPRSERDVFCESCGYDHAHGAPAAPPAERWTATIAADRAQFDRAAPSGVAFPEDRAPVALLLTADEVDLGRDEAGGDPAVSRDHVTLVRRADGSWAAVDLGSTNGTTINDDPVPIEPGVEVPLADGDCIRLGAWTAITLRRGEGG